MEIGTQAISEKVSLDTGLRRYDTKSMLPRFTAGFTFIELVVVISIVSIISSVLIFNYGAFDANIRLQNLAQDIALRIKEAQTVAMSGTYATDYSYEFQYPTNGDPIGQAPSYGIYFDFDDEEMWKDRGFAFFADRPLNAGIYDQGMIDGVVSLPGGRGVCPSEWNECLSITHITSLDHISGIYYKSGSSFDTAGNKLGITFTRPWATAHFSTGGSADSLPADEVYIEIQSLRDTKKHMYVTVNQTGQISMSNGCAPGHINDALCQP